MANKNERSSLTIRWQPRLGSPLGIVTQWLNSMNPREKKEKVEQICLMAFLPYALEADKKTKEEIERCYWEIHERLDQYLFTMRQILGIKATEALRSFAEISVDADQVEKQTISKIQDEIEDGIEELDLMFGNK